MERTITIMTETNTTEPSPSRSISQRPKLVTINIPKDTLQKLQDFLPSNNAEIYKQEMLQRVSGSCLVCRSIPDYMVIYDYDGASKVERYCTSCLEKSKMELDTI
jgi:hypothetical protein